VRRTSCEERLLLFKNSEQVVGDVSSGLKARAGRTRSPLGPSPEQPDDVTGNAARASLSKWWVALVTRWLSSDGAAGKTSGRAGGDGTVQHRTRGLLPRPDACCIPGRCWRSRVAAASSSGRRHHGRNRPLGEEAGLEGGHFGRGLPSSPSAWQERATWLNAAMGFVEAARRPKSEPNRLADSRAMALGVSDPTTPTPPWGSVTPQDRGDPCPPQVVLTEINI